MDHARRHRGTPRQPGRLHHPDRRYRSTAFRTGRSKSREAFLATLRAGHSDYIINEEAFAYMRGRNLSATVLERLASAPHKAFGDNTWQAHLAALAPKPVLFSETSSNRSRTGGTELAGTPVATIRRTSFIRSLQCGR
ncbi:hypothetical protein ACFX5Q_32695 [Mesorhizobium sp. IMUNJ 23033]|uniref:hypothetical protein n=1 Tax=Mesorhizobium sp. IMUNJ 23033 TaxID=3378039 RepID=UPI003850D0F6